MHCTGVTHVPGLYSAGEGRVRGGSRRVTPAANPTYSIFSHARAACRQPLLTIAAMTRIVKAVITATYTVTLRSCTQAVCQPFGYSAFPTR